MVRFIPRIGEINRDVTRMHVDHNFSARVMAEKYVKIYKNVIKLAKGFTARTFSDVHTRKAMLTAEAAIMSKALPARAAQAAGAGVEGKPGF
jgi:hypothetical protein